MITRRFLGEVDHLELVLDGLDKPVVARLPLRGSVAEGEDVGIDIAMDEVLVFPVGDT